VSVAPPPYVTDSSRHGRAAPGRPSSCRSRRSLRASPGSRPWAARDSAARGRTGGEVTAVFIKRGQEAARHRQANFDSPARMGGLRPPPPLAFCQAVLYGVDGDELAIWRAVSTGRSRCRQPHRVRCSAVPLQSVSAARRGILTRVRASGAVAMAVLIDRVAETMSAVTPSSSRGSGQPAVSDPDGAPPSLGPGALRRLASQHPASGAPGVRKLAAYGVPCRILADRTPLKLADSPR